MNNFKLERLKPNGLFVRFLISQTEMKTFGLTIRSLRAPWLKIYMVEVEGFICVCCVHNNAVLLIQTQHNIITCIQACSSKSYLWAVMLILETAGPEA